jgi:hypothetical protein
MNRNRLQANKASLTGHSAPKFHFRVVIPKSRLKKREERNFVIDNSLLYYETRSLDVRLAECWP